MHFTYLFSVLSVNLASETDRISCSLASEYTNSMLGILKRQRAMTEYLDHLCGCAVCEIQYNVCVCAFTGACLHVCMCIHTPICRHRPFYANAVWAQWLRVMSL